MQCLKRACYFLFPKKHLKEIFIAFYFPFLFSLYIQKFIKNSRFFYKLFMIFFRVWRHADDVKLFNNYHFLTYNLIFFSLSTLAFVSWLNWLVWD